MAITRIKLRSTIIQTNAIAKTVTVECCILILGQNVHESLPVMVGTQLETFQTLNLHSAKMYSAFISKKLNFAAKCRLKLSFTCYNNIMVAQPHNDTSR